MRRTPRSTQSRSSAASDVYKRQAAYNHFQLHPPAHHSSRIKSYHRRSGDLVADCQHPFLDHRRREFPEIGHEIGRLVFLECGHVGVGFPELEGAGIFLVAGNEEALAAFLGQAVRGMLLQAGFEGCGVALGNNQFDGDHDHFCFLLCKFSTMRPPMCPLLI
eukprot:TRINITY_DN25436_c0_g1_i1.p1 TRINITY_DN25436_c0_g1~~TRINITY_DN25436_c0_g1_i1.p1  ORF type:complete len:162 (+),score=25.51 TRINITY_DN25436_c0_g1_i1:89-574(+)